MTQPNRPPKQPRVDIPRSGYQEKPLRVHPLVKGAGIISTVVLGAFVLITLLGQIAGVEQVFPEAQAVGITVSIFCVLTSIVCWAIADSTRQ